VGKTRTGDAAHFRAWDGVHVLVALAASPRDRPLAGVMQADPIARVGKHEGVPAAADARAVACAQPFDDPVAAPNV